MGGGLGCNSITSPSRRLRGIQKTFIPGGATQCHDYSSHPSPQRCWRACWPVRHSLRHKLRLRHRPSSGAVGHQGRRHRQRLHLAQRQPSSDVHRHQGRRHRHRSGRLRPAAGRAAIRRRDQEDHRQADQVPDLQPRPLRSHRRRQGVQGCRRPRDRAQERHRAAQDPARTRTPSFRTSRSATRRSSSSAAPRSSCTISASTTPTRRW